MMQVQRSLGMRIGMRMLAGLLLGAVAWYPIGRLLFEASKGALGPVERGLPEIVRFLVFASMGTEAAALVGIVGLTLLARSGGSVAGAVIGMFVPGLILGALVLSLPADQTTGIVALVSPLIACFCSALCSSWREVSAERVTTAA
jgi:hypothetical protein